MKEIRNVLGTECELIQVVWSSLLVSGCKGKLKLYRISCLVTDIHLAYTLTFMLASYVDSCPPRCHYSSGPNQ